MQDWMACIGRDTIRDREHTFFCFFNPLLNYIDAYMLDLKRRNGRIRIRVLKSLTFIISDLLNKGDDRYEEVCLNFPLNTSYGASLGRLYYNVGENPEI